MEGLSQPFGMALVGDTFYVGNTDGVVAFPYAAGADRITAEGRKLVGVQAQRALDAEPAAERRTARSSMPASARSATSPRTAWRSRKAAPRSMSSISPAARAASSPSGLRNAVGLAWEPNTGVL